MAIWLHSFVGKWDFSSWFDSSKDIEKKILRPNSVITEVLIDGEARYRRDSVDTGIKQQLKFSPTSLMSSSLIRNKDNQTGLEEIRPMLFRIVPPPERNDLGQRGKTNSRPLFGI